LQSISKETTMKTRTLIALAVIAGFAATAQAGGDKTSGASDKTSGASASSGASSANPTFQSLDKNHDGSLSQAELKGSPQEKNWKALDKDRDGKISQAEFSAATNSASGSAATGGTKAQSGATTSPSSGSTPKSKY